MAEALRPGLMQPRWHVWGAVPLALLFLLPLALSLVLLVPGLLDLQALKAMLQHPQFWGALQLTLFTGLPSTGLALLLAVLAVSRLRSRLLVEASVFLSVPHLALALGLGFLIAPTGLLARLIAVLVTGWDVPPQWQTTQDPHGFALIAALVLKETPFLVWAIANVLGQADLRDSIRMQMVAARSLGHGGQAAFLRVALPQILLRIRWPLVAVLSYGLTVVDMALVIGPAQPPTLAQLAWTDLNDGVTLTAARGAAGTLLLALLVAAVLLALMAGNRMLRPLWQRLLTRPARFPRFNALEALRPWPVLAVIYGLVVVALLVQSLSMSWPFPMVLPPSFSAAAWARVFADGTPIFTSLWLAAASNLLALAAAVAWLETQPRRRDAIALAAATAVLCLPALLLALGQYRLLLQLGATGTWAGLLLVHVLPVAAYMMVMLAGPYRNFDPRLEAVGLSLGVSRLSYLARVKWPLLKPALLSSLAIGFAVSIAQFVPAQLAAAGRFSTLPMEAVTLSSGGNRAVTAAYALLLMALPLIVFQLSSLASRPRWSTRDA